MPLEAAPEAEYAVGRWYAANMKNRVETYYTNCKVENHVDRKKSAEVPKMLVDSSAEFTWSNAETLK